MKAILTIVAIVTLTLASSAIVLAHAAVVDYSPPSGETIFSPTDRVTIRFTERVEESASTIAVYAPSGKRVDRGRARAMETDPRSFSVGIDLPETGTYSVSWQVLSADDGHTTSGAYVFSYGTTTASYEQHTESVDFSLTFWEPFMIWMELLGQAILLGILVLSSALKFKLPQKAILLGRAGSVLIVLGTLSFVALKSWEISILLEIGFPHALDIFAATTAGLFAVLRAVLATAFLLVLSTKLKNWKRIVLWVLVLFICLARARVSHAAASEFLPWLSVAVNAVHLIAKNLWIGIVIAFVLLLSKQAYPKHYLKVLNIQAFSFGIAGSTGSYIVWLHLGNFNNLFTTDWGLRFVLLLAVGGIFLLPQLVAHWQLISSRAFTSSIIAKFTVFQLVAGGLMLALTSLMIVTTPPRPEPYIFEETVRSSTGQITLVNSSAGMKAVVGSSEADGQIVDITIKATNTSLGIGPLLLRAEQVEPNTFNVITDPLPDGNWEIEVLAQVDSAYDVVGRFNLVYPQDFTQGHRRFDIFTLAILLNAIAIMLTSGIMVALIKKSS